MGLAAPAAAQTLTIATLQSGTVNWELDTIKRNGFDTENGFTLEVMGLAGNPATRVAFQGGEADVVVADWIWVARQRAEGKDYVFIPYSRAVGGLLVPPDSPIQSLADVAGRTIGIAGGPVDKSWLILQAFAAQGDGFDLAADSDQVFGAPPLLFQQAVEEQIDATITFWHFGAKLAARGFRTVADVATAAQALGLDPDTPLLGYVVKGETLRETPELVEGLRKASAAAKALLASDDAAWEAVRPLMNAGSDAEFDALVAGFRAGIPQTATIDTQAARRMYAVMAELGGETLVGPATELPDGVFYQPGD